MRKKISEFLPRRPYVLLDELIGQRVIVSRSRDRRAIGLEGIVAYETKDAFLIYTGRGYRRIYKRGSEFVFPDLGLRVDGRVLYIDPARRTKSLDLRLRRFRGVVF